MPTKRKWSHNKERFVFTVAAFFDNVRQMQTIDLRAGTDELVIHYGGQLHSVEANTFANSLVALARIIEEISYFKYPDYKIEIRVEALAKGSFRPLIRLHGRSLVSKIGAYLPDKKDTFPILIALFSIYQADNADKETIIIKSDTVTITKGQTSIVIPRDNYETANVVRKNKEVQQAMADHFRVIDNDPSIENFGFAREISDKDYLFLADRREFAHYIAPAALSDERQIVIKENQPLSLLKVILERGARKWEFVWNGIRISAPVVDEKFWEDMRLRKIEIAQGDSIIADIRIHQVLDPYSLVYLNERYEIINVRQHIKAPRQEELIK
jgi:hypothetical protein